MDIFSILYIKNTQMTDCDEKINELKAQIKAAEAAEAEAETAAATAEPEAAATATPVGLLKKGGKFITYKRVKPVPVSPLHKLTNTHTIPKGNFSSILAAPLNKSAPAPTPASVQTSIWGTPPMAATTKAIYKKEIHMNELLHTSTTIPSSSLWNPSKVAPAPPTYEHKTCDLFRDKDAFDALLKAEVIVSGYDKISAVDAPKDVNLWFAKFEHDPENQYPVPSIDDDTLEAIKGWYAKCGVDFAVDKTDIKIPSNATDAMAYLDGAHAINGRQLPMFMGYVPELVQHEKQKQMMADAKTQFGVTADTTTTTTTTTSSPQQTLASILTENAPLSLSVSHTVAKRRQLCEYGLEAIANGGTVFKLDRKNTLRKVVEKQMIAAIQKIDEEYDTVFVSMMDYDAETKQMTNLIKKIKSCHPALFDALSAKFDNIYDIEIEMSYIKWSNSTDTPKYTMLIRPAIERRFGKILDVYEQIAKYDMEIVKRHKMDALICDAGGSANTTKATSFGYVSSAPIKAIDIKEFKMDNEPVNRVESLFTKGFEKVAGVNVEKLNNYNTHATTNLSDKTEMLAPTNPLWPCGFGINMSSAAIDFKNADNADAADADAADAAAFFSNIRTSTTAYDDLHPVSLLTPADYPSVYDDLNINNYPTLYDELKVGGRMSKHYPHLMTSQLSEINKANKHGGTGAKHINIVMIQPATLHTVVEEIVLPSGSFKELAEMGDAVLGKFDAPEFGFKKLFYYIHHASEKGDGGEISSSIKQYFDGVCHYSAVEINKYIDLVVNIINTCMTRIEVDALRNETSKFMCDDLNIKKYVERSFCDNAIAYKHDWGSRTQSSNNLFTSLSFYYNGPYDSNMMENGDVEYTIKLADAMANVIDAAGRKMVVNFALKGRFEEHMKAEGWTISGVGNAKTCKKLVSNPYSHNCRLLATVCDTDKESGAFSVRIDAKNADGIKGGYSTEHGHVYVPQIWGVPTMLDRTIASEILEPKLSNAPTYVKCANPKYVNNLLKI